jgi:hypothetical protein
MGSLNEVFSWSWDVTSEASVPSVWSAKTRSTLPGSGSIGTNLSAAGGADTSTLMIKYVKPLTLMDAGGTVVVGLNCELPHAQWSEIRIMLVAENGESKTLEPSGIRKGRKLAVKIPPLKPMDYDVRLVFHGRILHGSIPIGVEPSQSASF